MNVWLMTVVLALAWRGSAVTAAEVDLTAFTEVAAGQYQVLAQGGADIGREVNGFMNLMLQHYSRFFGNRLEKQPARVVVFQNRDDFRAYARTATRITSQQLAGYCHWKTDAAGNAFHELVVYEQDDLWRVLAHEGFHQFLAYELGFEAPLWLNEGLAQYFETSTVVNGRLQVGAIDPRRLQAAQHLIRAGQAPAVAQVLAWEAATFYEQAEVAYPVSWALVYYLLHRDDKDYRRSAVREYLLKLKLQQDSRSAFQRVFGRPDARWQRDFEQYVLRLK